MKNDNAFLSQSQNW